MLYVRIEFHTSVLECYNYIEEELIETSDGLMNVDLNVKVLIHVCKKGGGGGLQRGQSLQWFHFWQCTCS